MKDVPVYWTHPDTLKTESLVIEAIRIAGSDTGPTEETAPLWHLVLDNSPFYPGGGGQAPDRGTISGIPVNRILRSGTSVLLEVPGIADFVPGDRVECRVDGECRWDSRQQHSGQHLLSAALASEGFATSSVHLGAEYCGIEGEGPAPAPDFIRSILEKCDRWIREDRPIVSHVLPPGELVPSALRRPLTANTEDSSGYRRIVEIEDLDAVGCGGVHLSRTGQIRGIVFDGWEKMRGGSRLKWIIGDRVVRRARILSENDRALRRLLSAETPDLPDRVAQMTAELRSMKKERDAAERRIGSLLCGQGLRDSGTSAWTIDGGTVRIDGALERTESEAAGRAVFFLGSDDAEGNRPWGLYIPGGTDSDFQAFRSTVVVAFDGRGGGRGPAWRGTLRGEAQRVLSVAEIEIEKLNQRK